MNSNQTDIFDPYVLIVALNQSDRIGTSIFQNHPCFESNAAHMTESRTQELVDEIIEAFDELYDSEFVTSKTRKPYVIFIPPIKGHHNIEIPTRSYAKVVDPIYYSDSQEHSIDGISENYLEEGITTHELIILNYKATIKSIISAIETFPASHRYNLFAFELFGGAFPVFGPVFGKYFDSRFNMWRYPDNKVDLEDFVRIFKYPHGPNNSVYGGYYQAWQVRSRRPVGWNSGAQHAFTGNRHYNFYDIYDELYGLPDEIDCEVTVTAETQTLPEFGGHTGSPQNGTCFTVFGVSKQTAVIEGNVFNAKAREYYDGGYKLGYRITEIDTGGHTNVTWNGELFWRHFNEPYYTSRTFSTPQKFNPAALYTFVITPQQKLDRYWDEPFLSDPTLRKLSIDEKYGLSDSGVSLTSSGLSFNFDVKTSFRVHTPFQGYIFGGYGCSLINTYVGTYVNYTFNIRSK